MRNISEKCVILGHKNFNESDKLVFLYSDKFGRIKAIAKGARKITSKFTGHLETLNICFVTLYFGPRNIIITELSQDEENIKIKNTFSLCKSVEMQTTKSVNSRAFP